MTGEATGIKVQGGDVAKDAVGAVAGAISTVFESAQRTNMDQKTVRAALGIVERMGVVENVAITGCSIAVSPERPQTGTASFGGPQL